MFHLSHRVLKSHSFSMLRSMRCPFSLSGAVHLARLKRWLCFIDSCRFFRLSFASSSLLVASSLFIYSSSSVVSALSAITSFPPPISEWQFRARVPRNFILNLFLLPIVDTFKFFKVSFSSLISYHIVNVLAIYCFHPASRTLLSQPLLLLFRIKLTHFLAWFFIAQTCHQPLQNIFE